MGDLNLKTIAALAAVTTVLAVASVALANGGDIHFGAVSTGIPMVAVYVFGGFVGAVVLFFLVNWARYRRSQNRSRPSPRPRGYPTRADKKGATRQAKK
jgi:hypothetical protein